MSSFYCGKGGSDADDGTTWDKRKLTIASLLTTSYVGGDRLYVGPGAYREEVTLDKSGATVTSSRTVDVTEGSKIVTGTNTNWDPAVQPGDRFIVYWLASGSDGLSDGAGGFSSASETFEANCVGFCINIWERGGANGGSYLVATFVGGAPSAITLTDVNGIGVPAAGVGADYSFRIPSNEGTYEVVSVDSDTQITLDRPWSGPTYTGRSFEITRPVYLIGDNTGANTDGVGGIVRITGSDDDQGGDRETCIQADTKNYWVIKGFQVDTTVDLGGFNDCMYFDDCTHITIEDITSLSPDGAHIYFNADCDQLDIRRCAFFGGKASDGIAFVRSTSQHDGFLHVENVFAHCGTFMDIDDFSSVTVKNCMGGMTAEFFIRTKQPSDLGQSVFVHDCEIHFCDDTGLEANANGQIVANWCNFWGNTVDVSAGTVTKGAACTAYLYLPDTPILLDGFRYPARFFTPSEWWEPKAIAGLYGANQDMYGVLGPTTKNKRSWGPFLDQYITRETTVVYSGEEGSLCHPDARTTQFRVPISGDAVTVSVYVYLEASYSGTAPKLVVHQPGNTDVEVSATGTLSAWEQLSVAFTPNVQPLFLWVSLVSDNTASGADIETYWQHLQVEAS